jgi:gamma-glutamylcyclotransferase
MNYFAYGSNMSTAYLRAYCPSARFQQRAQLPNYRIEFRRYSTDLRGGTSTIIVAPGEMVHGVIYAVDEAEIRALDILEDVPLGIYRRDTFWLLAEDRQWQQADLYQVAGPAGPYTPSARYLDYMIAGAREHNLSQAYVARLVQWRQKLESR